jgi:hypothetical protein
MSAAGIRPPLERRIWIATIVLTVVLLVAGVGWGVYSLAASDPSAAYGRVPIPGTAVLHLPKGNLDVAYREHVPYTLVGSLHVPRVGLAVTAAGGGGPDPVLRESFGSTAAVNGDAHRRVFRMRVTRDGDYRVRADGAAGRPYAQFLFGHGRNPLPRILVPLLAIPVLWLIAWLVILVVRRRRPGL